MNRRPLITPLDCLEYMGINLHDIRIPDKLIEKYEDKEYDFYTLAMEAGIINKWGD